jgi:hypothetical protein
MAAAFDPPDVDDRAVARLERLLPAVGCRFAAAAVEEAFPPALALVADAEELVDKLGLAVVAASVDCDLVVTEVLAGYAAVSVELMLISCSRLFTWTSWLMYSFGSCWAVGS